MRNVHLLTYIPGHASIYRVLIRGIETFQAFYNDYLNIHAFAAKFHFPTF